MVLSKAPIVTVLCDVNEMVGNTAWLLEMMVGWVLAECSDRNGGESNFLRWKFLSIEQQLYRVGHPNVPELHCLTLGEEKAIGQLKQC